jgi:hypothetical protein
MPINPCFLSMEHTGADRTMALISAHLKREVFYEI